MEKDLYRELKLRLIRIFPKLRPVTREGVFYMQKYSEKDGMPVYGKKILSLKGGEVKFHNSSFREEFFNYFGKDPFEQIFVRDVCNWISLEDSPPQRLEEEDIFSSSSEFFVGST